ncbi:glycosyltransferase family 2 protein [Salinimicrobium oceani]|uniref:Glycosyltransferase family 2 protein n=1 Tax=Salinimicrobium oceani TaxID=2722702 RepID=A0ABX1D2N4_9FLAO|nr:glycosyltransferase family A protein [Salinimicrobium oceani]NJW53443.1 glycosyltransferase family 2 protein [Salinimicrobium oceani]
MISIITPTHNRAALLSRMINSVLKQSFRNWELVIMDDGSTDDTQAVVNDFKDSRIKYYFTKNSGAADKRNRGSEVAAGDYVIFLDSDDEVKEQWLEKLSEEVQGKGSDLVCCGYEKFDHNGKSIGVDLPKDLGAMFDNVTASFLAGSILIKKEIFEKCGGYDQELASGHHTDLLLRLLQNPEKPKISNIFLPLVKIHLHDGARIRHNQEAIYQGSKRFFLKHTELLKGNSKNHFDYLSVAGVSAVRTKRYKKASSLFFKALQIRPNSLKAYMRLIISLMPKLRDKFWKK